MHTLITGASRGIGESFARRLAKEGTSLVLVARSENELNALRLELKTSYGVAVEVIAVDLSKEDAAHIIYTVCQQRQITVNALINNAGFGAFGSFLSHSGNQYQTMLQVNGMVPILLVQYFLPDMMARQSGTIINVASMAAFQPTPYMAVYGATKSFMISLSMSLEAECRGTGVRVLTVCPGLTKTNFFEAAGLTQLDGLFAGVPVQSSDEVVDEVLEALKHGRCLIIPGWRNRVVLAVMNFLPKSILLSLSRFVLKKNFG